MNKKEMEPLLKRCRQMLNRGADIETIIAFTRRAGCSKIGCIQVLVFLQDMDLNEAKALVHHSKAWQDVRQRDEDFHEHLLKSIEDSVPTSSN